MGRSEHARSHKGAHAASRTLQLGIEEENRNALVSMCERSNRADHIKNVYLPTFETFNPTTSLSAL